MVTIPNSLFADSAVENVSAEPSRKVALNLGLTYTQSSQVTTFTFDGSAGYRARKFETGVTWNYVFTRQETGDTQQSDLFFNHTRFRRNLWFNTGKLGFQTNDEQGLDLRVILSGTYGRYTLQTNARRASWAGGLAANQEFQAGGDEAQLSLEGLLTASFHAFRYKDPELNFLTALTVYPGITERGRVRADFTAVLAYEIFKDFTVSLNLVDNYDSRPPVEGASQPVDDPAQHGDSGGSEQAMSRGLHDPPRSDAVRISERHQDGPALAEADDLRVDARLRVESHLADLADGDLEPAGLDRDPHDGLHATSRSARWWGMTPTTVSRVVVNDRP